METPKTPTPPERARFDVKAFAVAKQAADAIFETVPEARSVAVLIDFGFESPDIPCASWHTPDQTVDVAQVIGMLKRVPSLYQQLVSVMMTFTQAIEEKQNAQARTDRGSDCPSQRAGKRDLADGGRNDAGGAAQS